MSGQEERTYTVLADLDGRAAADQGLGNDDELDVVIGEPEDFDDSGSGDMVREDDEPPAEDDAPPERASRKNAVEDRVNRALRLQREAEGRADTAERRANQAEEMFVGTAENTLKERQAAITAELETAVDNGESKDIVRLTRELTKVDRQMEDLDDVKARRKAAPAARPAAQANPLTAKWKAENEWFDDPTHEDKKAWVFGMDKKLVREGYDPQTPAYFTELNRRKDRTFPELARTRAGRGAQAREAPRNGGNGAAESRVPSNTAAPASTGSRVVLTPSDLRTMRTFKLDPNNKAHLREFAAQKRLLDRKAR